MEDCILYDWVSITSKVHDPKWFIEFLGLSDMPWELFQKNAHGYQTRYYFDSINIHFDNPQNPGSVWLEMSGQGCRSFETHGTGDYDALFQLVLDNPDMMNLTRLDVAFDDRGGLLDMDTICDAIRSHSYVSRFDPKSIQAIYSEGGSSAMCGSPQSEIRIRIYDKAAERGYTDGTHWVRVELQLRRDRAEGFLQSCLTVGETFRGVLHNYLRFVVDDGSDSNIRRWPMTWYWESLLDGVGQISIYSKPGVEYNLKCLEKFLFTQVAGAAYTYMKIRGVDRFVDGVGRGVRELNPKYKDLIDRYGQKGYNIPVMPSPVGYFDS